MVGGFAKAKKPFPTSRWILSQPLSNGHTGRQNPNTPYLDLLLDNLLLVWNIPLNNSFPTHLLCPPPSHCD